MESSLPSFNLLELLGGPISDLLSNPLFNKTVKD